MKLYCTKCGETDWRKISYSPFGKDYLCLSCGKRFPDPTVPFDIHTHKCPECNGTEARVYPKSQMVKCKVCERKVKLV